MSRPPKAWVDAATLQAMFNNGGYWKQIKSGLLRVGTMKDRVPSPPPPGHPPGTHSQYIRYVNQSGRFVVAVHQYVLPNGRIGGSGRPDPKELVTDERHYVLLLPPPAMQK